MESDQDIIDVESEDIGSTNRYGQLIVQTFAGDMAIGADGLAEALPTLLREVLESLDSLDSPDSVSGALLARFAADPRFAGSLQVGTTPSTGSAHTMWLRHHHQGTWWVAEGPDPDTLKWETWGQ